MVAKHRWTQDEKQYLRDHYRQGDGLDDCARHLDAPKNAVKKMAARIGVAGTRRPFTDDEIAYIKEHYPREGSKVVAVTLCEDCHKKIHFGKRGELQEYLTVKDEGNLQPSRGNVLTFVPRKVQRLIGEDAQSNKPDTSAANGELFSLR